MALRVLLADESSTIKKVFQLALQDFAVDVRPVNVGTDVVQVARSFQPDIIFADVLLQKRSGYEVAAELKQLGELNQIPVVLMYSAFMDLDEDKFLASHANAQLEKPFEVQALRKLVTDLVPRTQGQRISQFLSFPKMPEIQESAPAPAPRPAPADEFEQVSIPSLRQPDAKYRVDLKPEEMEPSHVPVDFRAPDEAINVDHLLGADPDEGGDNFAIRGPVNTRSNAGDVELERFADDEDFTNLANGTSAPSPPPAPSPLRVAPPAATAPLNSATPAPVPVAPPTLDAAAIAEIVRTQSAAIIQDVVWKVVPDLAAQIIERELQKLLRERESSLR